VVISADTSFLFALYGNDVHTPQALAWTRTGQSPICVTDFADFELGNALRFAEICRRLDPGQAGAFLAQYEADRAAGRIQIEVCNLASVLTEAKRLSATHTLTHGHRGFDILHVAAALQLGATHLLTFDANQKKLAIAEGLGLPI